MAIRKNRNKAKLSPEQVQDIRYSFFNDMNTIEYIATQYPVSERTMFDPFHAKGAYTNIEDTIDPSLKGENRLQWRTYYSTNRAKKEREKRQSKKIMEEYNKWQYEQVFGEDADKMMKLMSEKSEQYRNRMGGNKYGRK